MVSVVEPLVVSVVEPLVASVVEPLVASVVEPLVASVVEPPAWALVRQSTAGKPRADQLKTFFSFLSDGFRQTMIAPGSGQL